MAEPTADDRDVDARRDEVHGGGVPEGVRRHMLGTQRRRGFCRSPHVGGKLEPDTRGTERFAITVDEQPLVRRPWLSLEQLTQQQDRFRPERADAFLSALAGQAHAARAFEPDRFGAQIERFLYSCAAVVEEREQRMVAHTLDRRTVGLSEDRRHFRRIEVAGLRYRRALDRDVEDFDALRDRWGILGGHEVEEAADRGKSAVARADRAAAVVFGMAQERGDLAGGQIGQRDHRHLLSSTLRDETRRIGRGSRQRPRGLYTPDRAVSGRGQEPRSDGGGVAASPD